MSSTPSNETGWEDIDYLAACQLDLRHRVAWATEVVARVNALYSPHFQQKYHQQRAVDFARRFYRGEPTRDEDRRSIIHAIEDSVEEAEAEGYSRNLLSQATDVLIEINCNDGKGSTNAVDYASLAYASHILFRQGVRATGIPVDYVDSLAGNLYAFAWKMFKLVQQHEDRPIMSIPFQQVTLGLAYSPLPREVVMRSKRTPPAAETEYLARLLQG